MTLKYKSVLNHLITMIKQIVKTYKVFIRMPNQNQKDNVL